MAKNEWGDAPVKVESPLDWGDKPAAQVDLPEGVKPSAAGAGRGSMGASAYVRTAPSVATPSDAPLGADTMSAEFGGPAVVEDEPRVSVLQDQPMQAPDAGRRLSLGAGPINQQTAARAEQLVDGQNPGPGNIPVVQRAAQGIREQVAAGERNTFGDLVDTATLEDRRADVGRDMDAQRRREFAEENPVMGGMASGSAGLLAGTANIPQLAADAFNKTVVDPVLGAVGMDPVPSPGKMPGTDWLTARAAEYAPVVGQQPMTQAWDKGEFGPWLVANMAQQSPQIAQSIAAAFAPPLRAVLLPGMGAQSAGMSYAAGDDSRVALAKGAVEIGTEMLPLKVFDRVGELLSQVPAGAQRSLLAQAGQKLMAAGGAITANSLTNAIEESVAQVSGNALDRFGSGKDVALMDGVPEAAVIGGVTGAGIGAPQAVIAGTQDRSPQGIAARELADAMNSPVSPANVQPAGLNPNLSRPPVDRSEQIKTLRAAGDKTAADLLQRRQDREMATFTTERETEALQAFGPAIQQRYRESRAAGAMPGDAVTQTAARTTFEEAAQAAGLSEKAREAALAKAATMPADKAPGFLQKALQVFTSKGLAQPIEGADALATTIETRRDELLDAVLAADIRPTMNAIEELERTAAPAEAAPVAEQPAVEPVENIVGNDILVTPETDAVHQAATSPLNDLPEPTQAQKEAGNYKLGRVRIAGMDISVENPQGSVRRGTSPDGTPWETTLSSHYGYFRGTTAADGDKLDVFIKPGTPPEYSGTVFVVDQIDPDTARFDEHKVLFGAADQAEAEAMYRRNYSADWQGLGAITALPMPAFKAWATSPQTRKPLGVLPTAANVQNTPQATPQPQTARVETPAPAGSDGAKAAGLPDTRGTGDAQADGVEASPGLASPDEQRRASAEADRKRSEKRARLTSNAWTQNPLRAFLGKHGISSALANEFAPGPKERRQAMVPGYGPIFRKAGKNIDMLAEAAREEGFIQGEDTAELYDMIARVFRGEKVIPMFAEGVAEQEMESRQAAMEEDAQARFEDYAAQQAATGDDSFLPDDQELLEAVGYNDADATVQAEFQALIAAAEAEGIDTEALLEDAYYATREDTNDQYRQRATTDIAAARSQRREADARARAEQGRQAAEPAGREDGKRVSGAQGSVSTEVTATPRPDGTLAVKGDTPTIRKQLADAGITNVMPMAGGVMVGKSSAKKAQALFEDPVLTSPTREDVEAQQDRAATADTTDQREQVRRESEAGAGMFELAREDGRQDTTGRLFANEPQGEYTDRYETDLFGNALPAPAGKPAGRKPAPAKARNVQPTSTVPGDTPAPDAEYFVRTIVGSEQDRKLGASRILTPQDAAQATAYLYRSAVERFDGIVTDKGGKPLAVVGGFKGATSQASVYGATMMAEAIRVPGAARIWFSHNHPSGTATLSEADMMVNGVLSDLFEGSGIEPMGIMAVAGKEFTHQSPPVDGQRQTEVVEPIPAPGTGVSVPVMNRELVNDGADQMLIESPAAAQAYAVQAYARSGPGVILLNAVNRVSAWMPLPKNLRGNLRNTGGLAALYRAASESNASAAIVVHGGELGEVGNFPRAITPANNIAAALSKVDVRALDIIDVKAGTSAANQGLSVAAGPVFARSAPVQSEAFKKWFGDSKVVDADGKPQVMYHGTNKTEQGEAFTMFDAYGSNYGLFGQGAYFTDDASVASEYTSKGKGSNPTVYSAYMAIKNPIDMDARGMRKDWVAAFPDIDFTDAYKPTEAWKEYPFPSGNGSGMNPSNESFYRAVEEYFTDEEMPKWEASEAIQDGLRKMGYDGITHIGGGRVKSEGKKHRVFIAFDPEQIKSATGNTGTFDPSNPDIRASRPFDADMFRQMTTPMQRGMTVAAVEQAIAPVLKRWKSGPPVTVVATPRDLPMAAPSDAHGVYWKGKVYIVAANVRNTAKVMEVLGHEAIAHYGLRDMLGKDGFRQLMNNVQLALKSGNKPLGVIQAEVRAAYVDDDGKFNLTPGQEADEIAAKVVEQAIDADGNFRPGFGFVKAVYAKIVEFLRSLGLTVKLTMPELQGMLVNAQRGLEVGKRTAGSRETLSPVFARAADAVDAPGPTAKSPAAVEAEAAIDRQNPPTARQPDLFTPGFWETPQDTRTDKFIFELQDGRIDLKRVQQAIAKTGAQISEQFDARLAETLYPGRVAQRAQQFLEDEAKPLLEVMARNNVPMNELSDYLHARGAEERNAQIAKVNPDLPDGGAGRNSKGVLLTNAAARQYLAGVSPTRRIVLDALAKRVDAMTKGTRQLLVDEGLEKAETIKAWEEAYQNYVPMFRDEAEEGRPHPTGSGMSVRGSASKRATGSTKEVTNILAHVLMQREAAITRAEKNRVAVALYGMALSNPNPDFWTTIRPGMAPEAIGRELQRMGVDPTVAEAGMKGVPTIRTVDPVLNRVVDRPNPIYKSLPGAIVLKVNGEDRVLMLNERDPRGLRMAENLKNLDGLTRLDLASRGIGKVTRWLASVNTQYNPAFGLVNLTRDTLGGAINLSSTRLRGKTTKVLAMTPAAIWGIGRELSGLPSGEWGKAFREFQKDGGQTGYREMFKDANDRTKRLQAELKSLEKSGKLTTDKLTGMILGALDVFNTTLENAVRLAAYREGRQMGMSRPEAARLGRELTVDFNRKGRTGRELSPLYAFFNASVQGSARTLQTLAGPAGAKIIAGGVTLGVMQAIMLLMAGYEDDEIPEFVKARAFIIPLGTNDEGKREFATIPLPLGLHVLPNTGRVLAELTLSGGEDIAAKSFDAVGEIGGAFNPLGGGNIFTGDGFLRTIAPSVVDPFIETLSNKNFSGMPIERESQGENDPRPGFQRAKEATLRTATGQTYTDISRIINTIMGGNEFEKGVASPSPEIVRYWAQVVGGGLLREVEKTVNASVAAAKDEPVKPSGIPVVGRFFGEVDDEQVQRSRYFDNLRQIETIERKIRAAEKANNNEAADRIEAENPLADAGQAKRRAKKEVTDINKEAMETIGDSARLRTLDAERTEVMRELNEEVDAIKLERRGKTPGQRLRESLGVASP